MRPRAICSALPAAGVAAFAALRVVIGARSSAEPEEHGAREDQGEERAGQPVPAREAPEGRLGQRLERLDPAQELEDASAFGGLVRALGLDAGGLCHLARAREAEVGSAAP